MNITSITSLNVPDHSHNKTAQHWSSWFQSTMYFLRYVQQKRKCHIVGSQNVNTEAFFYRHCLGSLSANKKKKRPSFTRQNLRGSLLFLYSLIGHTTRHHGWSSLVGWKQALSLGMLQNGIVAEVVLVWGLNAEGSLCSHASHCLAHI